MLIDANGIYYKQLNKTIRDAVSGGEREFELINVNGQRYIATGLEAAAKFDIRGVPGNDLAAFMNGPQIVVHNSAQDGIGNTMNEGKVVIHGDAGDVLAYGMRGGKLHILGDVGYRIGIHMKAFKKQVPVIIVGGTARDFFGEYMAGGVLILLGLEAHPDQPLVGDYVGTGMHGGTIYIRGEVPTRNFGKEVGIGEITEEDKKVLTTHLKEYCADFGLSLDEVMSGEFTKLYPQSHRPYGKMYAY